MSLAENSAAVLVPLDKIGGLGIRRLITKSEVSRVLRHLAVPCQRLANWKQRDFVNLKRLSSGSADDLALSNRIAFLRTLGSQEGKESDSLDDAERQQQCEVSDQTACG